MKEERRRFGGAPANAFFIPFVVVLTVLHVIVIVLMFNIFSQSSKLSQVTQSASAYVSDATSLLAGTSMLSETASNYVLVPVTGNGEPNVGPLLTFANEMKQTDHRGEQVLSRFETYDVSDEVLGRIEVAAHSAETLVDMQTRALALTSAVYPLPNIPALADFELPALSAEDAALPNEGKIALAHSLILSKEFGENRHLVSENVNAAAGSIRAAAGEFAARTGATIEMLRTLLMASAFLIVVFLIASFIMFYRLFVSPLGRFSRRIVGGQPLDDKKGLRETRLLAGSFNELLHKRDDLEGILREAAETDTLTGLPNRYSLQQHRLEDEGESHSLAVFLFDVDYLKQTNDTYGHAAGDDLIRRAAYCISSCFTPGGNGRCYRMGGDEFAAIIKNIGEDEIPALATKFEEMQAQNNVSISWGYGYAAEILDTSFKALMDKADQSLYAMKEETHRTGGGTGLPEDKQAETQGE